MSRRPRLRIVQLYLRELGGRAREASSRDHVAWSDTMKREAPRIEGWLRKLANDRLEIFLKADGRKIRASGGRDDMYELVDWFEAKTGLAVNVPDRVYTGPRPIAGQMALVTSEPESTEGDASDG